MVGERMGGLIPGIAQFRKNEFVCRLLPDNPESFAAWLIQFLPELFDEGFHLEPGEWVKKRGRKIREKFFRVS